MSAFIVGLTGGIGSGKSQVSALFEALDVTVVDADLIAREVVAPGTEGLAAIAEHFGAEILEADGSLNRAALRTRVFNDEAERRWLNALTHPLIRSEMVRRCREAPSEYALMVVPLMVENKLHTLVDRLLVVDLPEDQQRHRTASRDNTEGSEVDKIIARQASRAERLALADDVIDNSGSVEALSPQVRRLHQQYLTMARNRSSATGV
ncbi:dephospho-CoA kinase [Ferrimonas balearica]|uniref:dephospho-CoA kinase n=1 Tax=Ferrimonas balearica TaxID=44012 RepID=UPI001C99947B|nr:dephospho-CoA kinase [Ferrimonas balearica]MBY5923186.1 dephospho-CoA kinase [Ferrimonas balearica]MBY5997438.1 dephospho-CoA kinase [Ferrimonas balearica]